ncbi:MAG: FAD/NAD(P)-binding oxidoreductase [Candidatus Nanopelagicales bacterium]|nr:NAD(P)/FAD-dependent oxidoreductase [Candidatus Nanopelagicales bacterium]MCF8538200.1 NAD(P)/FAD-dependent oxidoreductase [Candidatus Nanopelagicales bacterium]MCF8542470.1 NAD(P)/FAD-dependent oxidoreductase [Candidatus Nanopelagicales bacterium]MCF8556878.1 NAD(P)/FAD-dependent oxidoreductase [Candidatus Nanopelagicales bacterium]
MTATHDVVIIGGGAAGITTAARLKRAGITDIAVIEPSETHYYQPMWTLVGGGEASIAPTARPQSSVIPKGVTWIKAAATGVDPEANTVSLDNGDEVHYSWLVVAAGIQLNWDGVPGLVDTLGRNRVSSNYSYDLAPQTWEAIKSTTSGTAVFTQPNGPIKCAGAPQKIAYLAADHWQRTGVLKDMDIHLILPTPGMFGVPEFAAGLTKVAERYGINVHFESHMTAVDGDAHTLQITKIPTGEVESMHFDMMHVTPPQSAPDWIKASPLADPNSPFGYMEVDKFTLQHTRFPNIFGLGDCTNTPNSKTAAAVRKQSPVLVANLVAARKAQAATKSYNGYASCPLITAKGKCIMAEFDYDLNRTPTFPMDMTKERWDMYQVKKNGLPILYWNFMLKGVA